MKINFVICIEGPWSGSNTQLLVSLCFNLVWLLFVYSLTEVVPSPARYNSPISESLISFLDSFSPPPAFASEFVPANFNVTLETIRFSSSTTYSKSKRTKFKSVVSRVLGGILCSSFFLAIAVTAGCKLAICVGAK